MFTSRTLLTFIILKFNFGISTKEKLLNFNIFFQITKNLRRLFFLIHYFIVGQMVFDNENCIMIITLNNV